MVHNEKNDGRAIPNFINQALFMKNLLFMVMEIKQDLFAIFVSIDGIDNCLILLSITCKHWEPR